MELTGYPSARRPNRTGFDYVVRGPPCKLFCKPREGHREGTLMRKSEAERAIVAWFREHLSSVPYGGADGGLILFNRLAVERPDLLSFRSPAQKWTLVSGWLRKHKLLKR